MTALTLERIAARRFADPVPAPGGYHHVAATMIRELGSDLAGVDLVITVDAGFGRRHRDCPGSLLAPLPPGDPITMGVSERGVVGPFTALQVAHAHMSSGVASRVLILIMERSTLPPEVGTGSGTARPVRDVAVALLLGPDGDIRLDAPTLADTSTGPAALPRTDAGLLVTGADLRGTPMGVPVRRAGPEHRCAGVWLALADLLAEPPDAARLLIADRDPVLPYVCTVALTLPAAERPEPTAHPVGHRGAPVTQHPASQHPATQHPAIRYPRIRYPAARLTRPVARERVP